MLEKLFNYPFWDAGYSIGGYPMTDIKTALFNLASSGTFEIGGYYVNIVDILERIARTEVYAKIGMILAAVAVLALIIIIINQIKTRKMLKKLIAKESQAEE